MKPRSGLVLLLALVVIVALELTAAALHFTALQQVRAARAGSRALQLRLSAQTAAVNSVDGWPAARALAAQPGWAFGVPAGTMTEPHFGITGTATAGRLDDSLFLITGEARSPLRESARVGLLVIARDPARGFPDAALRSAGSVAIRAGGRINAASPDCADAVAAALELPDASALSVSADGTVAGQVLTSPDMSGASLDALLPLPLAQLLAEAVQLNASTLSPVPVSSGTECATSIPGNWGEPDRSVSSPCSDYFPVLRRDGDFALNGGRGQGLLYVSGDLEITAGARFDGLIIVAGRLSMSAGSSATGLIITRAGLDIADAAISGSRCALRNALSAVRILSLPYTPRGRRWIPVF